jgi:uroporphyrinogen-III synthase
MAKGVLVTRPLVQGLALCRLIEQTGRFAYAFPTIAFESITPSVDLPLPEAIDTPVLLIITSQHALEYASPALLSGLRRLAQANKLRVITLGNATAQAALANHLGAHLVAPNGADSEWLLNQALLADVAGHWCVLLTGQHGRDLLVRDLKSRGAHLQVLEVYRRKCPEYLEKKENWQSLSEKIGIIIITSFDSLLNLFSLIPSIDQAYLKHCHWIVPSERVKKLAHKRFDLALDAVAVAQGAGHQAILNAIAKIDPI